ncbi:hypothetical protein D3C75_979890 [compost metagenome]
MIFPYDRAARFDEAKRQSTILNFPQFYAIAINLDLKIHTPHKFKISIWQVASGISGAIQLLAQFRMVDKSLLGNRFIAEIASSNPRTTNILLTRQAGWKHAHVTIQHVKTLMFHSLTVGYAGAKNGCIRNIIEDRPDRAFRCTTGTDHSTITAPLPDTCR